MKRKDLKALDEKIIKLRNQVIKIRNLKRKKKNIRKILMEIKKLDKKLSNENNGQIREWNKTEFYCVKCRRVTRHYTVFYRVKCRRGTKYCPLQHEGQDYHYLTWFICKGCEHIIQDPSEIGL